MTECLSLMELSCALVPTYLSTLGRRSQERFRLRRQSMWPWPRVLRKTIFMRYLSSFILRARDVACTTLKKDNQGATRLKKTPVSTPNRKHVDVRHHFLRKRDANGEFEVADVWSALHHAAFLTKDFQTEAFRFYCNFEMNLWRFIYFIFYFYSWVLRYGVIETKSSYVFRIWRTSLDVLIRQFTRLTR